MRTQWAFPSAPPWAAQQNPSFFGYGITCATPSLVIVQRRTPCLCNADPCALMPVQCRSGCHDHTLGPPHLFFPMAVPTQLCAKRSKICIWKLMCVEGVLADCHQHAKHSPSWWQSDFPKQRSKIPHTQSIKYVLKTGLRKRGLELVGRRPRKCPRKLRISV